MFGSEPQTKGSLCGELTVTNKEEPVDLGEKWRIMKRSRGEKKTLAVCLDVSLVCHETAFCSYLLIEIQSPARVFCLSCKMLPVSERASLVGPHQRGDMLLTGSLPCARCCIK